ncbi:MAG: hypothetical protein R3D33_08580 [Hyphomicrobiaceae bacterium]
MRDVLVEKGDPSRTEWTIATLRQGFDQVLVHGDAAVVPFAATFPAAGRIADLIVHTGYIAEEPAHIRRQAGRAGQHCRRL